MCFVFKTSIECAVCLKRLQPARMRNMEKHTATREKSLKVCRTGEITESTQAVSETCFHPLNMQAPVTPPRNHASSLRNRASAQTMRRKHEKKKKNVEKSWNFRPPGCRSFFFYVDATRFFDETCYRASQHHSNDSIKIWYFKLFAFMRWRHRSKKISKKYRKNPKICKKIDFFETANFFSIFRKKKCEVNFFWNFTHELQIC